MVDMLPLNCCCSAAVGADVNAAGKNELFVCVFTTAGCDGL